MSVEIKKRRTELNLTLEQIGNYVGVSKSTVKKWENGNIKNMRRDKILLLSQILNVSPLDFLDFNKSDSPKNTSDNTLQEVPTETVKKIEGALGTPLSDVSIIYKENNTYKICLLSDKPLTELINFAD